MNCVLKSYYINISGVSNKHNKLFSDLQRVKNYHLLELNLMMQGLTKYEYFVARNLNMCSNLDPIVIFRIPIF